jgi:hypothetical protein
MHDKFSNRAREKQNKTKEESPNTNFQDLKNVNSQSTRF